MDINENHSGLLNFERTLYYRIYHGIFQGKHCI